MLGGFLGSKHGIRYCNLSWSPNHRSSAGINPCRRAWLSQALQGDAVHLVTTTRGGWPSRPPIQAIAGIGMSSMLCHSCMCARTRELATHLQVNLLEEWSRQRV